MRLNSITQKNIGVVRDLHCEFGTGLIALVGPQGSGKSTTMNAFYGNLTNDFKRIQDTKEEVVNQHAAKSEKAFVTTAVSHAGTDFVLTRTLAPSSKNHIQTSTGRESAKAPEVEAILNDLLGANRKILGTHVFVEQWQLRALLHEGPAERAATLSQLCGTAFIEKRLKKVTDQLKLDQALQQSVSVLDLDAMRQELGQFLQRNAEEDKSCRGLQARLLDKETVQLLTAALAERERIDQLKAGLPAKTARLENLAGTARRVATEHTTLANALLIKQSELEGLSQALTEATAAVAEFDNRKKSYDAWQALRGRLATVEAELRKDPPEAPTSLRSLTLINGDLQQFQTEFSKLQAARHSLDLAIQGSFLTCDKCGQSIPNAAAKLAEAQADLVAVDHDLQMVQADLNQVRAEAAARTKYDQAVAVFNATHDRAARERDQLADQLDQAEEVEPPTGSRVELEATRADVSRQAVLAKTQVASYVAKSQAALAAAETARAQHEALAEQLAKDLAEIEGTYVFSDEECDNAKQLLAVDQQLRLELAGAQARRDEYAKLAAAKETAIEQAEKLRERSAKLAAWLAVLGRVTEVLHRDNLPKRVHTRALRSMEGGINEMLAKFESPFRVSTSEDLSYICRFSDNTVVNANRLSGGQQVVLMLAFRWVTNLVFAGQIGMLWLDEPTAGLDMQHMELLENALISLGAAAKAQGVQVFLITHEHRLKHVCDQVVELERTIL